MSSRKTAPSLRFRGFGEPWEEKNAAILADYSKGNGYSKSDLTKTGTPIILYGRLYTKYEFVINDVDTFTIPKRGSVYSQGNEVIIPASGETAEDIARAAAIEKPGILLGGDLNILRPFDFINPLFLALAISNGKPQKDLIKKAQGKSVVHIHNSDIQGIILTYPSKIEQNRIVEVFRNLDRLIALEQRKYDKLNTVKKSMLEKMFPQKGAKVPEIRFKGFSEPWEEKKLGEIFTFKYGNGNNNPSNGGKYPVFGAGGVQGGYSEYNAENSVIIGHMGDAGCVSWGEGKHYVTYNGTITKPKDHIFSAKFGYYLLFHMNLRKYRGGSGLPFLTYDMLTEMETVYPADRFETDCIEMVFSNLDRLITLQNRKIEKLRNLKKACLEKMFV